MDYKLISIYDVIKADGNYQELLAAAVAEERLTQDHADQIQAFLEEKDQTRRKQIFDDLLKQVQETPDLISENFTHRDEMKAEIKSWKDARSNMLEDIDRLEILKNQYEENKHKLNLSLEIFQQRSEQGENEAAKEMAKAIRAEIDSEDKKLHIATARHEALGLIHASAEKVEHQLEGYAAYGPWRYTAKMLQFGWEGLLRRSHDLSERFIAQPIYNHNLKKSVSDFEYLDIQAKAGFNKWATRFNTDAMAVAHAKDALADVKTLQKYKEQLNGIDNEIVRLANKTMEGGFSQKLLSGMESWATGKKIEYNYITDKAEAIKYLRDHGYAEKKLMRLLDERATQEEMINQKQQSIDSRIKGLHDYTQARSEQAIDLYATIDNSTLSQEKKDDLRQRVADAYYRDMSYFAELRDGMKGHQFSKDVKEYVEQLQGRDPSVRDIFSLSPLYDKATQQIWVELPSIEGAVCLKPGDEHYEKFQKALGLDQQQDQIEQDQEQNQSQEQQDQKAPVVEQSVEPTQANAEPTPEQASIPDPIEAEQNVNLEEVANAIPAVETPEQQDKFKVYVFNESTKQFTEIEATAEELEQLKEKYIAEATVEHVVDQSNDIEVVTIEQHEGAEVVNDTLNLEELAEVLNEPTTLIVNEERGGNEDRGDEEIDRTQ